MSNPNQNRNSGFNPLNVNDQATAAIDGVVALAMMGGIYLAKRFLNRGHAVAPSPITTNRGNFNRVVPDRKNNEER